MTYHPIENYAIIGDLNTVALVGRHGSIDFLCFPDFDSPSVFAALLDDEHGGHFRITPQLDVRRTKQQYLPDTNILLTRFLSEEGMAEISDFMPVAHVGPSHALIRRAKAVRGGLDFEMRCAPRFDYARAGHRLEACDDGRCILMHSDNGITLRLLADVPLRIEGDDVVARFHLDTGEDAHFILEEVRADQPLRVIEETNDAFKETANFWRDWLGQSTYSGLWRSEVHRSALTLKLLTSYKYGSTVAAPTFGLPEEIGGERNWDYRYSWVRDSAFTLYALMRLGFTGEAAAYMKWIEERCFTFAEDQGEHPLQIMYALDGSTDLEEKTLDHLEGYRGSQPVRIGNGAAGQLQLDIYGELMDSVYLYDKYGSPIHYDFWQKLIEVIDWVCENWQRPDYGIWEVRGGKQHFLYSRLMCWVAVDRGVRLALKRSLPAPLDRWQRVRSTIHRSIYEEFWNDEIEAFTQTRGGDHMDAATLLMPLVRFISPDDPRWLSTLRRIEEELVDDALVYRYRVGHAADDGLDGEEGAFCMCSFWYAECLSRAGDVQQARLVFEKMLGYANHVGLFAEEISLAGEHLGNFPQAFTHLALISTAFDLDRRLSDAGWRA